MMGGLKALFFLGLVCLSVFRPTTADVSDNVERLIDTQAELLREIFNELTLEIENLQINFDKQISDLEAKLLADTDAKIADLQSQIDDLIYRANAQPPLKVATKAPATEPPPPLTTAPPPPPTTTLAPTTTLPTITTKITTVAAGPPSYRHCQDVRDGLFDISGNYIIDPDGPGGLESFEVYCNLTDTGAFTVIGVEEEADMPVIVSGFDDPGSFVFTPTYKATAEQILAVVEASSACTQYITYTCRSAVLLSYHKKKKKHHGWLVSRDGEEMLNWGGAPTNSISCACGVDETCAKAGVKCNCDTNNAKADMTDSGYLDDISTLPISAVHLGDTGSKKEMGKLTLGGLSCSV